MHGTGVSLAIGGMCHKLTFDTVLLGSEHQGAVGGSVELCNRASEDVGNMKSTDFDLDVFEPEGVLSIPSSISVFVGME